jgi:predicted Zn-dependent peptidase
MNAHAKTTTSTSLCLSTALALVLAAPPLVAQAPGAPGDTKEVAVSKVERKNRAPVSKEVLRVRLPKPVEVRLDNGVTVLILEDRRFPVVAVQLQILGAGGLYEPRTSPGLASATVQMLREGTKTRTSRQIAEEIDRLGATVNAFAGSGDSAAVLASGLSSNFDQWFPLAADALLRPSFPPDELDKLKQRLKVQVRQNRSQPGFLANERFLQAVYGDHPAAAVTVTPESIDALTAGALAGWHRDRFTPQNTLLGIAGDVSAGDVVPKLKEWLGGWARTNLAIAPPPIPTLTKTRRMFLVDRPGSVQTTINMGNLSVDRRHPDYIPMVVMNRIVGGGPSARLFLNLREEKGYTYGVYSNLQAFKYAGPWLAGGDMRTDVTDGAITEFLKEIQRIRDEKVGDLELEEARRSVVAAFALSLEQPTQLLGYALTAKTYGFPADYWDSYPAKILAVTADDVQRVARAYVDPQALQVAAVGDGGKIKAVLEKYGPVEVYDAEGRVAAAPVKKP